MSAIALFFSGVFLCNAVPHLVCGLQGAPFPSPFATPHGVGDSSPLVNFLWGAFNLIVGLVLLSLHPVAAVLSVDALVLAAGALAIGIFLARHFGRVQAEKRAAR